MEQLSFTQMSTEEQIALLYAAYPTLFIDQVRPETLERLRLDFLDERLNLIENAYQQRDNQTVKSYISEVRALADNPLLPRYITALIGSYEGSIDGLTRLRNRSMYQSDLEKEVARAVRNKNIPDLSLALVDIDYLKRINDTNGHPFGDIVIKSVADLIKISLRTGDTAYRFGGDESAVILPDTTLEGALIVAKRILEDARTLKIDRNTYPVGLSIGITQLKPEDSATELYKRADKALYQAKENGRNCIATETGPVYREH